jgi:tetratricopeptide (TPR) repeat protein
LERLLVELTPRLHRQECGPRGRWTEHLLYRLGVAYIKVGRMKAREELLKKVPKEGFLKITQSRAAQMSKEQRVALIRKGNNLFNQKQYDLAKKIFLTTGYSDGLIRLGDLYMNQNMPLEALRMYWLAPDRKKVDTMLEKTVGIIQKWLQEGDQDVDSGG